MVVDVTTFDATSGLATAPGEATLLEQLLEGYEVRELLDGRGFIRVLGVMCEGTALSSCCLVPRPRPN